jgi:hypothetical protein
MNDDSSSKKSTDNFSQSDNNTGWFRGESKGTKTAWEDFNQCGEYGWGHET